MLGLKFQLGKQNFLYGKFHVTICSTEYSRHRIFDLFNKSFNWWNQTTTLL